MDGYTSPSAEADRVYYRAGLAFLLIALAAVAWLLFATRLDDSDPSTWLGIWLGVAVTLTVSSAAVALLAAMTAHHQEVMRAVLTRSNA